MDRLAHPRRGPERERQIRHAARDLGVRQLALDPLGGLDEVDRVGSCSSMPVPIVRMFGSKMMSSGGNPTCSVRILVGAVRDLEPVIDRGGLAGLVERHHDHRGAELADDPGLADELGLALLERDRVDDALALQALEAGLDHRELRRIDHHRDPRDVGLGGDEGSGTAASRRRRRACPRPCRRRGYWRRPRPAGGRPRPPRRTCRP